MRCSQFRYRTVCICAFLGMVVLFSGLAASANPQMFGGGVAVSPIPATFCASEGQTCNIAGSEIVLFGANGSFVSKSVTNGPIPCTNTAFRDDPALNVSKACYVVKAGISWIKSISYTQTAAGDTNSVTQGKSYVDIHVVLLQGNDDGFPCVRPAQLVPDALSIQARDVTSADSSTARIVPNDLLPKTEANGSGYYYQLEVGQSLDLPNTWQTFTFQVLTHCSTSGQLQTVQTSPAITVRRNASADPLQLQIVGDQPQWFRSSTNQDTLQFELKSGRPVAVESLVIRDSTNNNIMSNQYKEVSESTDRQIVLVASQALTVDSQYIYDIHLSEGGVPVPAPPLPTITLRQEPIRDYIVTVQPSDADLTVRDKSADVKFTASTNDDGTLEAVFDNPASPLPETINGVVTNSQTHTYTFTIPSNDLPPDGRYAFSLTGVRKDVSVKLNDNRKSVMVVDTKTQVGQPIGLSLQGQSVILTYCLSKQNDSSQVQIFEGQNTGNSSFFDVGGASSSSVTCAKNFYGYTATLQLDKSSQLFSPIQPQPAPNSPNSSHGTPQQPRPNGGSPVANGQSAAPPQQPVTLCIRDASTPDVLESLSINVVLVSSTQDSKDVTTAINGLLSGDKTTQADATKALLADGLDQNTIDSLTKMAKGKSGAASTIGTVLGTLAKSFTTAYFGIPAAATATSKQSPVASGN